MRPVVVGIFSFLLANPPVFAGGPETYGPFNVDGGKETCHQTTGTELKKFQAFTATGDRFFRNPVVSKISGWAQKGDATCQLVDQKYKKINVKSSDGFDIPTDVLYEFTVFAHADCGTSPANFGKTISIECSVSAEQWKYSNQ